MVDEESENKEKGLIKIKDKSKKINVKYGLVILILEH